jgi:ferrous iron transport protein A
MHRRRGTSLLDWPLGQPTVFVATHAGPSLRHRLAHLGVRAGTTITPIQRTPGGGVVIAVGELRVALDRKSVATLVVRDTESREVEAGKSA